MQKRLKSKNATQRWCLEENLDDDSKTLTDDEIEEARRSASCILFLSVKVKTKYTTNIANFNIHIHKPYNHISYKTTKLQLTIQRLPL